MLFFGLFSSFRTKKILKFFSLMYPTAATHHGGWLQWWMLVVGGISGGLLWWVVAVGVRGWQ